jgi:hypothetical protein
LKTQFASYASPLRWAPLLRSPVPAVQARAGFLNYEGALKNARLKCAHPITTTSWEVAITGQIEGLGLSDRKRIRNPSPAP